jgi:hypothetical protein
MLRWASSHRPGSRLLRRLGDRSLANTLALLKEPVIDSYDLHHRATLNADAVVDHKRGELVAIDEYDALSATRELPRAAREIAGGDQKALRGVAFGESAQERLDVLALEPPPALALASRRARRTTSGARSERGGASTASNPT